MRIQTRKILLRAATAAAVACTAAVILLPAAVSAVAVPAGGLPEQVRAIPFSPGEPARIDPASASPPGNHDNGISSIRVR